MPKYGVKWLEDADLRVLYLDYYRSRADRHVFSSAVRFFKRLGRPITEQLANDMAHMLALEYQNCKIDCIVPVVNSNQVCQTSSSPLGLVSSAVASATRCEMRLDLVRNVPHESLQINWKDKANRKRIVYNNLEVTNCHDLTILLVDDVMTTGATLQTYAAFFKDRGASVVGAAVIGWHDKTSKRSPLNPGRYDELVVATSLQSMPSFDDV